MAGWQDIDVRTCPYCNRAYMEHGAGCCDDCVQTVRDLEEKALAYARSHPNASMREIVVAAEVPAKIVDDMVERGQFVQVGNSATHPCKSCGKMIVNGIYCDECKHRLHSELNQARQSLQQKKDGKERRHLSADDFGHKPGTGRHAYHFMDVD